MASTTIGSSGVTFPDATTQSTAPVNTNANVTSATAVAGTGISVSSITTTGAATHTITNTGVTSVTGAGTVSVSASTGGVTITGTGGSGTVTSVATGNGLSGGTITTSGTLVIACPTLGSVGSYAFISRTGSVTQGSNYAPDNYISLNGDLSGFQTTAPPAGSWKWMGASGGGGIVAIGCRVS